MRTAIKITSYLLLIFLFSCEDMGVIIKCDDCFSEEPQNAYIDVKINSDLAVSQVLLNIYEGKLEDSILYKSVTVTGKSARVNVSLNKIYALTATYNTVDGTRYVAVDAAAPKVRYDKDQCDEPCYFVYDNKADLRIKYTK